MKSKLLNLGLISILAFSSLYGCKGNDGGTESPIAESKNEQGSKISDIKLRFSWWGGDERNTSTADVIKQFEALNEGVKIEAEYGGNDGYHDKLATQLASGTAPDIIQVDPEIFPTYVTTGDYFVDIKEFDIDLTGFDEKYISQEVNGRFDGKQLGLPTGISGAGILVNKDLLESLNIDLTKPYTWGDLITYGKEFHEKNPENYLISTNKEYTTNLVLFNYVKQLCGGSIYSKDTGKLVMTEDELKEALLYIKALYDNNVIPPASYQAAYVGDDLQSDANWIDGKYGANLVYVSTIDVMVAANPEGEYYMGELPMLADAKNAGWGSNTPQVLAVTKTSSNSEVAVDFLDYFFNNEDALLTLGVTRAVPPTAKAREICSKNDLMTDVTKNGADIAAAAGGTTNDKISSSPEAKSILCDAVEAIGYGAGTPVEVATSTYELLKELEQ
ncbi:MAG: ABC transporter substrate-binding protein [Lachnospirales bacterium]